MILDGFTTTAAALAWLLGAAIALVLVAAAVAAVVAGVAVATLQWRPLLRLRARRLTRRLAPYAVGSVPTHHGP